MADFKEMDELKQIIKELGRADEIVRESSGKGTKDSIEDFTFLDDDLDDNFLDESSADAFLNEVGESLLARRSNKKSPVRLMKKEENVKSAQAVEKSEEGKTGPAVPTPEAEEYGAENPVPEAEKTGPAMPAPEAEEYRADKSAGKRKGDSLKRRKTAAVIAVAAALVFLLGGGGYLAMGQRYEKVFFPNTQINGIDVSNKTIEEVKQIIASGIDGYVLTIEERDGKTEEIKKEDIMLHSEFDGSLEELIEKQEPLLWLKHMMNPSSYEITTMMAYDEAAFLQKVNSLDCMNESLMKIPENARLSEYVSGRGYSIVPEIAGSTIVPEVVNREITDAIMNLKERISLEEAGAYAAPEVTMEDVSLVSLRDAMNQYVGVTITYKFGDKTEVLSGERIHEWLIQNEDHTISVDPAGVAVYVEELAISYDTYNKAKTIKTSYGPTIKVTGGTYGWKINRSEETKALTDAILSGQSSEREPVYSQKAASRGPNDYGNTYVEINLTAQHLFFYKDGSLLVESDFVSGNLSRGWGTPGGTYPLSYKERNATLKGENYRTPVDYWMPYNGGIGLHDAKWRSSFGGTIYKTGGSHGCVNLPHSVAKKIFDNITSGAPVIGYFLPGTEAGGSSTTKPPETTAAPTEAPVSPTQPVPPPTQPAPPPVQPVPPTEAPAGPGGNPQPTPPQIQPTPPQVQPTQVPPETTAPAGPGSDNGFGSGSGPGSY